MDTIKILPHHVRLYFDAYFLKRRPGFGCHFYGDERLKQFTQGLIKKTLECPSQPVQIVSAIDLICAACPRNKNEYFRGDLCEAIAEPDPGIELEFAQRLEIEDLIDAPPITAEMLFKRLECTYQKLLNELAANSALVPGKTSLKAFFQCYSAKEIEANLRANTTSIPFEYLRSGKVRSINLHYLRKLDSAKPTALIRLQFLPNIRQNNRNY